MAVYDMTTDTAVHPKDGKAGYTIHKVSDLVETFFELYTDDGKGNGDFICRASDHYWAERIACALDNDGYNEQPQYPIH